MIQPHSQALFVADAPGLDFLNSVATPADTQVDWIDSGAALLAWLEQAQLVPPETLHAMRVQALPGELDAAAAQARALREWFRSFVRKHKGRHLTGKTLHELEPLNRLLERDEAFSQIVAQGKHGALELQATRRWRSPESLLLPIAEAMAQLVCEKDFADVKACEGAHCTLLFVDATRGRARRWCSMAMCGNRAKVAAHRERRRTQA